MTSQGRVESGEEELLIGLNRGRIEREAINNSLVYTGRGLTLSNAGHHNNKCGGFLVRAHLRECLNFRETKNIQLQIELWTLFRTCCVYWWFLHTGSCLLSEWWWCWYWFSFCLLHHSPVLPLAASNLVMSFDSRSKKAPYSIYSVCHATVHSDKGRAH